MRFSSSLSSALTAHFLVNTFKGQRRFPLVLTLEPTHRCNLFCAGRDRIRLFSRNAGQDLTVKECVDAAVESAVPVVTVTGGEPLLYEGLKELLQELFRLKRHVYLCTNGLLADQFLRGFEPDPRLIVNFHLNGLAQTHDGITGRPGTFRKAVKAISLAKERGFRVWTNTSMYKGTGYDESLSLFWTLTRLGVDGILVSPAFGYESVGEDIFLKREEATERFRQMDGQFGRFPIMSTPLYLDFLKGKGPMECTPWGNPTRNIFGWKSPCYLITDRYYETYSELMTKTRWDDFGPGKDPRCENCMVHSGFEATAMRESFTKIHEMIRMLLWNIRPLSNREGRDSSSRLAGYAGTP
jgi:hopanoid biosynthesis associated radical SAM protein HpnH